jgi:DNA processing protein
MTDDSLPPLVRDLRLALNAATDLPREAVCRLARDTGRWLPGKSGSPAMARELGVPAAALERAFELRSKAAEIARREEDGAAALGVAVLVLGEEGYPAALLDLALPPPVLFVRGRLESRPGIAVVGSRRMDAYGREVATLFARELARTGLVIVSGFAHGVDATAHRAALEVPAGRTVAVLGCGHGVDYPRGHRRLGEEIAASGALVSEFPCGREPTTWSFPIRNRIIAALSHGSLIVQAAARSGSLVTARLALELGREVYAVPGRIFDDKSIGPNTLLRDGAALVQHPRDILDGLPAAIRARLSLDAAPPAASPPDLPGLQGRLVSTLRPGDLQAPEDLAVRLKVPLDEMLAVLLELELLGRVRRYPGPAYGVCA